MVGATFPVRIVYGDRAAYAKGGLVDAALAVKRAGRHGDTEIIHINKAELAELKRQWGEPTINPETGMPEFFLGKIGKALKKVAKVALPIASVAANFIPGVGPLVSAGLGAAGGLINGGGIGGALAGAAPGLLNGGMNQLTGGSFGPAQTIGGRPAAAPQVQAAQTAGVAAPTTPTGMEMPGQNGLTQQPQVPQKKPNFFNQDSLGIGIKNKHIMLGGLLGGALLSGGKKNKGGAEQTASDFFGSGVSGVGGPLSGTAGTVGSFGGGTNRTLNQRPMEDYYKAGSLPEYEYFKYAEGGDVEARGPSGQGSLAVKGVVEGVGDGRADTVDALLSDGEYVFDAESVALLGNGSNKAGAKALDSFRVNLRKHKGKNLAKGSFSVKAKSPEAYLRKAG